MKKILGIILSACMIFLLGSCKPEKSTAYEKQLKQFKFKLSPISAEALVKINYRNEALSPEETDKVMREYKDYLCFRFEISIDNFKGEITEYYDKNDSRADYDKLMSYYLFDMQNDLYLTGDNGEKIPCNLYVFERNYELTKSNRFMVVFKKPQTGNCKFTYDNRYLNIGKVNFLINNNDFIS